MKTYVQREAVVNLAPIVPEEIEYNLACLSGEETSARELLKKTEQREALKESQLSYIRELIAEFGDCFIDRRVGIDLIERDIELVWRSASAVTVLYNPSKTERNF